MDEVERKRLKELANDAIIASFGSGSREQRLAEGLERALEHIEDLREWRPTCDCGLSVATYAEAEEDGEL